jgi:predicted PhzF superfamily epimerase YddE/YHI9
MLLEYNHVDVFSQRLYGGNSLPVFLDSRGLSTQQMLQITKELRHFEAIFLEPTDDRSLVRARVFDLFEELAFDVATGSAAGTVGAYRLRHGLARGGEVFVLNQGRFTGRPSTLRVQPEGTCKQVDCVKVGGDVALVGRGILEARP